MIALFGIPAVISFLAVLGMLIFILGGRPPNTPPGPEGIPILGYAPFVGRHPWRAFASLKKRFGSIVSFYLGPQFCIVLQDYDAIRAAFIDQGDIFTGRAHTFAGAEFAKGQKNNIHGLTAFEGEKWQATRNFVTETLEDLGAGKLRMEKLILSEVLRLQEVVQDHNGWGFDIDALLRATTSNILSAVCFGRRFPHGSDEYRDLTKRFRDMHGALTSASLNIYPWLRFIGGPLTAKWDGLVISRKKLWNLMSKELTRHEQAAPPAEVRDLMDAYLRRSAGNDNEEPAIAKPTGKDDIIGTLIALYVTGSDFTHNALLWSVLIMCLNPPHRKRIQEEMDNVIGQKKSVEYADRGYVVPPKTKVYANIWSAHRDPQYWKNPLSFDPRRFINPEEIVEVPPCFMMFSMGERSCPGQNLAQMMLFLTFSNLFHRFSFKGAKGHRLPGLDEYGQPALSASPKPFLVQASPRF